MSQEEQGALNTCFLAKGDLSEDLYYLLLELNLELSSSQSSSKLVPVGSLNRENHCIQITNVFTYQNLKVFFADNLDYWQ